MCGRLDRGRHEGRAGPVPRRSVAGIFALVLEMPAGGGLEPRGARPGGGPGAEGAAAAVRSTGCARVVRGSNARD
jgi:hypothetical protein